MDCECSEPGLNNCNYCRANLIEIESMFGTLLSSETFSDLTFDDVFFDLNRDARQGKQCHWILNQAKKAIVYDFESDEYAYERLMFGFCSEQLVHDASMKRRLDFYDKEKHWDLISLQLGYWLESNLLQFVRYSWHVAWFLSKDCLISKKHDLWRSFITGVWAVKVYQNSIPVMLALESNKNEQETTEKALQVMKHGSLNAVLPGAFEHIKKLMTEDYVGNPDISNFLQKEEISEESLLNFSLIHRWCRNPK